MNVDSMGPRRELVAQILAALRLPVADRRPPGCPLRLRAGRVDIVTLLCYTRRGGITMTKSGRDNPNWRGGRSITSHGYVLIRVGKDHHLADVRGYAYEHRLVAEQKLGRRLKPGELIHHQNGDKADNCPKNIVIVGGNAEHYVYHRKRQDLRLPRESNPTVKCKCGCGKVFEKFDASNRPRQYISGHNPHPAPTQTEILRILERGGMHRNQIARLCERPIGSIATALGKLKRKGSVVQIGRGVWALREVSNGKNKD